ncbi:hypothetical protein N0V90_005561 [Kalmusia sp. IMI 367209]|nr:hypothetical protein N0V90_005561 [Kalmusia sp. IMI 367209]
MRSVFHPTLGAALSLGASGALANIICEPRYDPGANSTGVSIPSVGTLVEAAQHCIEDVCATAGNGGTITKDCGPIVLTITQFSAPPSDTSNCVDQFHNIISQCITTEVAQGGTSETHHALYEISVGAELENLGDDWSDVEELHDRSEENVWTRDDIENYWSDVNNWAEKRTLDEEEAEYDWAVKRALEEGEDGDDDEEEDEHPTLEARRRGRSGGRSRSKKTRVRPRPKTKPKTTPKTKPKTTPKTKSKTKSKTKPKKPNRQPKACPLPKQKGTAAKKAKGSKTIRAVVEDYLPQAVSRALFPRGNTHSRPGKKGKTVKGPGGKQVQMKPPQNCLMEEYYKHETLLPGKVNWSSFNKKRGWNTKVKDRKAKKILTKMRDFGKLDIIGVKYAYMSIEGNPSGGTSPSKFTAGPTRRGSYVLCNGGFFNMKTKAPVGETSLSQTYDPIPPEYADDYVKVNGNQGFIHSGPSLLSPAISYSDPKWRYSKGKNKQRTRHSKLTGSLAHASQPNERLVLVTMKNHDRLIFVYTARKRSSGLNTRGMRDLMLLWVSTYTQYKVSDVVQAVNLDGGGSIYVSWNHLGVEKKIAAGNIADEFPAGSARRKVANVLKIAPSTRAKSASSSESESEESSSSESSGSS